MTNVEGIELAEKVAPKKAKAVRPNKVEEVVSRNNEFLKEIN